MRVLYLIDSLRPGGAERSLVDLTPHLLASGVDLEIAVLVEREGLRADAEARGARVTTLEAGGSRRTAVRAVRALLHARGPDLLHTTLFEADVAGRIAARLERVPVTSSIVNAAYGPEHRATPGIRTSRLRGAQALDAATARLTSGLHANASFLVDLMARRLRIPADRFTVIPRGRDPQVLGQRVPERTARVRAELGIADHETMILAAARHEHQKGLDVLLDAFGTIRAQLPDAVLVVAGREGSATPTLEARAAPLGEAVRLLGSRDDVADLMAAADVFVLPSRWEGFPGTVVEALALETPVVASDLPGVREAGADTVTLVPPERPAALARAVVDVATRRAESRQRAARGRARFLEQLTTPRTADALAAFWASAAKGGSTP